MSDTSTINSELRVPKAWQSSILLAQGLVVKHLNEKFENQSLEEIEIFDSQTDQIGRGLLFCTYLLHSAGLLSLEKQVDLAKSLCGTETAERVQKILGEMYQALAVIQNEDSPLQ